MLTFFYEKVQTLPSRGAVSVHRHVTFVLRACTTSKKPEYTFIFKRKRTTKQIRLHLSTMEERLLHQNLLNLIGQNSAWYVSRQPVSDWGMYLGNPYQTGVCISPTKTLHQAASPSAVYVSHQAEYCTKHQALPTHGTCISQALSAPPATAITPSEDQTHPWGLS